MHKKEILRGQEDHEITEREARAYQAKKTRQPQARRELDRAETKLFLSLVSQMASSVDFETKLSMKRGEVEYYKGVLDIEDYTEARKLLAQMDLEDARAADDQIENNRRQAREAEAAAQARLDEYEREKAAIRHERAQNQQLDPSAIADEDARRQREFDAAQAAAAPESEWRLPESNGPLRNDILRRFQHELEQQGWNFCKTKYGVGASDLKAEAARLGLKVNWDIVPR